MHSLKGIGGLESNQKFHFGLNSVEYCVNSGTKPVQHKTGFWVATPRYRANLNHIKKWPKVYAFDTVE